MERTVIQLTSFSKNLDAFIKGDKLSEKDFEEFERRLVQNPQEGDVIPGLSGIRKTRLKSVCKGTRGGFRIDYLDIPEKGKLYLIVIYAKNVKNDLNANEKRIISKLVQQLKEEARHE